MAVTRTQKTCTQYIKRANSIISLYNSANKKTQVTFEQWLSRYISTKTLRTWTTYRAALIHALSEDEVVVNHITTAQAIDKILNLRDIKTLKKRDSKATSRLKYKHLPLEIYERLKKDLLKESASKYDLILYHWLRATRATGLRPHEWMTLSIKLENKENQTFILTVLNGKHTNGRSFAEHRALHLTANASIIRSIMLTWKALKENHSLEDDRVHERFYKACRDRLLWVNARIGCRGKKKRITIYSARHQFKADMQLKGLNDEEIAALMGHGSIATASINYGKKRFARDTSTTITPSKIDVKKVQELNVGRGIKEPPFKINSQNKTALNYE